MNRKMIKVKICGITNIEDAKAAVEYGVSALGFIFYKKSPRYISPSRARKIIDELPPFVTPIGVFVNHRERAVKDVCNFTGIRTIQLHGDEDPNYCKRLKSYKLIKAFRVQQDFIFKGITKYPVSAYLFDTFQEKLFGGTGKIFNWELLANQTLDKPVILSGGLSPKNIAKAIKTVRPYAVDVSSGVEKSPGQKNPKLIKSFLSTAQGVLL